MGKEDNVTLVNDNNLDDYSEVDLLCAFELEKNKYIVYSKNDHDCDGYPIVYCGKINEKNNKQYIENIDREELSYIKNIIKSMVDYNSEVSNV